jgi:glutaredoxin
MVFALQTAGAGTVFFYFQYHILSQVSWGFFMPDISRLVVYTLEFCPNCDKLKTYLQKNGVPYSERDLSTAESLTELRVNGVFVSEAPVLQKGDEFLTTTDLFSSGSVNERRVSQFIAGA